MPVPVKQPAATSDLPLTFTDCLNPAKVAVFGNFSNFVNSVTRILRFISHLLLHCVEKNPPHNLIKSETGFLGGCDKASVGRQAGICIDFKNPR